MTRARKLSVSFHNFWRGFDAETSYFVRALRERFDVEVARIGRDVQFFSIAGRTFPEETLASRALKVWFTGEPLDARHLVYDLYVGFSPSPLLGRRAIRLPLWAIYIQWWDPDGPLSPDRLTAPRRFVERPRFCNFLFSNPVSLRNEFFVRLNARKAVESSGSVLNNMGARAPDKLTILREHRFTIAFENSMVPGYVTEKLLHPLAAGSIPIYWGAPECREDFNPDAFIDATRFSSLDALVEHVIALDADRDARARMAEAPIFRDGVRREMTPGYFAERIEEALDTPALRGPGAEANREARRLTWGARLWMEGREALRKRKRFKRT